MAPAFHNARSENGISKLTCLSEWNAKRDQHDTWHAGVTNKPIAYSFPWVHSLLLSIGTILQFMGSQNFLPECQCLPASWTHHNRKFQRTMNISLRRQILISSKSIPLHSSIAFVALRTTHGRIPLSDVAGPWVVYRERRRLLAHLSGTNN